MKAAVYKGRQRLEVEEMPTPEPGPGQVVVKVLYSAICGTDVHAFLYDVPPPGTVLGHEFSGTVTKVGPGVTDWSEGDRVVSGSGTPPPGKGPGYIHDPRYNYRLMGFPAGKLRGYAEYVLMEEWEAARIPEGLDDRAAALSEPCSIGVRAVRLSELRLGDAVAVLGAGPIGMFTLQTAKAAGAATVYVSEPTATRTQAALALGADAVVDPTTEDVVARMESLNGGEGPDVVFDCAGVGPTLDQAFNMVRKQGQVVLVAVPWEQIPVLPVDWMAREVKLQTTFGSRPEDQRIALDLLRSGQVSIEPMVSEAEFIPLDDIQRAFEALVKPSTQLQMVVRF